MATLMEAKNRDFGQSRGSLRALRASGRIPAVIYGQHTKPQGISVNAKDFLKELKTPGIGTRVFDLGEKRLALVHVMDFPPVKDTPEHIDFLLLGANAVVSIPLRAINAEKSPGVVRGGVINMIHHELKVYAPSDQIPHEIVLDLSGMQVGQTLHAKDIHAHLPKDVILYHIEDEEPVLSIVAPVTGLEADTTSAE